MDDFGDAADFYVTLTLSPTSIAQLTLASFRLRANSFFFFNVSRPGKQFPFILHWIKLYFPPINNFSPRKKGVGCETRTHNVWVMSKKWIILQSDGVAKIETKCKRNWSNSIDWVAWNEIARQRCPTTVRRGGFWLLPFGPDPSALSLYNRDKVGYPS